MQNNAELVGFYTELWRAGVVLPMLVLDDNQPCDLLKVDGSVIQSKQWQSGSSYHPATIAIPSTEVVTDFPKWIEAAIEQFLTLTKPGEAVQGMPSRSDEPTPLLIQQHRLAEKLKERLGYLGVYYKRNPSAFLRYMTQPQKQELLQQLKNDYREIVLNYFSNDLDLNKRIDRFVNVAFLADIPVSLIVEIHMELMDEFSKQLKLEGRSDEVLLDYRLTLIDAIAHLCEMYRRSIPRES
ncbi:MAG: circadian clock protein KaiA [Leptolyngbyaceae cyanobacterium SL_7_1]|nr:circadian clock protein KaiA [Leptolyngbyaceae cyanobacterium SL_7_1]